KYKLGLIGKNENEKVVKGVEKLEEEGILEKVDIGGIEVFGVKINMNELDDLNEEGKIDVFVELDYFVYSMEV
ncbi:hypothetical protein, partial [Staphylococcus epidermidis]|uniref:hypothetical protein n=1 Tax=Staphylococcus epidermidis TaxID=1282 RepID=UPI0011A7A447